ncbi:histone deacetylase family protein [Desulfurococcus amylolyticus]|uniref:Histone deacetylase superfamily n=1 Tax=Desulfurococcus amylolyticus DSM 16532 TaxID=768672 RepID=I3XSP9_DESAM|nr:histone deacetylase family protein [Desulfurococcus amylolyticus]AFL66973.1 histone deacetylase superfamily [Desulfurococcus amylolyticus DSM 16532]
MIQILVSENSMHMHVSREHHPENPERIVRVISALKRHGIRYELHDAGGMDIGEALSIARRIHSRGYIDKILMLSKKAPLNIDQDTYLSSDTLTLALETLYTSYLMALNLGRDIVFYIARPPGHHAGYRGKTRRAYTQGFCIFNNAVAAVHGLIDRGFKNIGVLDFDAHYGNGSMELLYTSRILQVDLHQDTRSLPVFPWNPSEIGAGDGYGYKIGIPLEPGTGDDSFVQVLGIVKRIIEKYNPEALVVSAGFDGFIGDGLTDLVLTEYSYYRIGYMIQSLGTPVIIVLEGGYSRGLDKGLIAFIHGLTGARVAYEPGRSLQGGIARINLARANKIISRVEKYIV